MKLPTLNDDQNNMLEKIARIPYGEERWSELLRYFEYLLGVEGRTRPRGWMPAKLMMISPEAQKAMIWMYSWHLQIDAQNHLYKVNKLAEIIGENPHMVRSWQRIDSPELTKPLLWSKTLITFTLYSVIFPQEFVPASRLTVEQIGERLAELQYDTRQIQQDLSTNTGKLYGAFFDAQACSACMFLNGIEE